MRRLLTVSTWLPLTMIVLKIIQHVKVCIYLYVRACVVHNIICIHMSLLNLSECKHVYRYHLIHTCSGIEQVLNWVYNIVYLYAKLHNYTNDDAYTQGPHTCTRTSSSWNGEPKIHTMSGGVRSLHRNTAHWFKWEVRVYVIIPVHLRTTHT